MKTVKAFSQRLLYIATPVLALIIQAPGNTDQLRLIEIDPGHSHLSGLHTKMLPGVSEEVHIYSPLSPELTSHLAALSRFNNRADNPTQWSVRVFAGPRYLEGLRQEKPGAVVALSGQNRTKLTYIEAALKGGHHVFADKPWIVDADDLPRFEAALKFAREKSLITYDWMTLRADPAYRLVRDLVADPAIFGVPSTGSVEHPAVHLENLHALLKFSHGVPQLRPASFLDVRQQGEGMADVGSHLADLVQWTLFPGQAISYRNDIKMLQASHSALMVTQQQFTQLTGEVKWPTFLQADLVENRLRDYSNGECVYAIRGIHTSLKVQWQFQAPAGAQDSYFASYQGTRALVELRAGPKENYVPHIFVTPAASEPLTTFQENLHIAVTKLNGTHHGLSIINSGRVFELLMPQQTGSGDHLQALFEEFAAFVRSPKTFPEAENINLLTKYYITTKAVALANGHR